MFNHYQELLVRERYTALERRALLALGQPDEIARCADLKLHCAQLQRNLKTMLYFIEVRTHQAMLHKIGVTTRLLDQRLDELHRDPAPHFSCVVVKPLGTWPQRGNVEPYFKYRYRRFQRPIGSLIAIRR